MARTAAETVDILRELYQESFNGEECEPYKIGWDELRGIAGVERLTDDIIANLCKLMLDCGHVLVPFNYFLMVGTEGDYSLTRSVPPRLVESYLAVTGEENSEGDEEGS